MDRTPASVAWVYTLARGELRDELVKRGLSTMGTVPSLRERLRRAVEAKGGDVARPPTPSPLELPAGDLGPHLPDSPGLSDGANGGDAWWWDDRRGCVDSHPPPSERPPGTAQRAPRRPECSTADAYNIMRRWNLTFSGTRGGDAEAFLLRIEEGRQLVPVEDGDIFKCLPFFLSGIALHWFRLKRTQWRDWGEFETAWRARFGEPDYQYALRDEILRRTQGEHEPVADFLTSLQTLLSRLRPPWSLADQLNQAFRNMLPRLQISIHRGEFRSFDELEALATRLERSHLAVHTHRAPPAPEDSLFPALAYRPPGRRSEADERQARY